MVGRTNAGGGGNTILPIVSYTGTMLSETDHGNWKIKFLTSGTLTFVKANNAAKGIDIFAVGGGGGGGNQGSAYHGGGGGGGGYTTSASRMFFPTDGSSYTITIGEGGAVATNGGTSSFTDGVTTITAAGGVKGTANGVGGNGGSGGGGKARYDIGGNGGSDGANGGAGVGNESTAGGTGQVLSTREFGEPTGDLYAGGGAGGSGYQISTYATGGAGGGGNATPGEKDGTPSTGGGGAGGSGNSSAGGVGGSGIVIIRNARF